MSFSNGFEKTASVNKEAFIGLLASGLRAGAGAVGRTLAGAGKGLAGAALKGANKALGGPLGTVATGFQAAGDYKNYKNMMNSAIQR